MTMREKMARAMCERAREQGSRGLKWADISEGHRREWLGLADVAIDELRKAPDDPNIWNAFAGDGLAWKDRTSQSVFARYLDLISPPAET